MSDSRMSYWDQLRDPRWQKKSAEVKQAAGWRCEDCGAKDKQLSAHHSAYISGTPVWQYDGSLLMCLCDDCHKWRQSCEDAFRVHLGHITRFLTPTELEQEVWEILDAVVSRRNERMAASFS